jgi:membrane-associated protein
MELIRQFVDLFLHLDKHLGEAIQNYGTWTYGLLALIVFCETGLVITPILPGDSLLFAAGLFAGLGHLNIWVLFGSLTVAAVLGDTLNYHVGKYIGPKVFSQEDSRIFKKAYLEKTARFYAKYGAKTVVLARFVPIVRTFAPFVAGVGSMEYPKFLAYNVIGAVLWVGICLAAGYYLGGIEVIRENFSIAVLAVIFVSILPALVEMAAAWRERKTA